MWPKEKDQKYKVVGTTTRILQLIDEKKLNFDTSVSEQVSEFRHPEVTVGHLLLHTSGLQGDFERKDELKDKEDREWSAEWPRFQGLSSGRERQCGNFFHAFGFDEFRGGVSAAGRTTVQ